MHMDLSVSFTYLGEQLYIEIMQEFLRRMAARHT
jgi:hypothetical protein